MWKFSCQEVSDGSHFSDNDRSLIYCSTHKRTVYIFYNQEKILNVDQDLWQTENYLLELGFWSSCRGSVDRPEAIA